MKPIDKNKINQIINILKKNPQGLWIRELSRRSNLDKSTVSNYVNKHLKDKLEVKQYGNMKFVKLK